jgi:thioredoxin reductase
VYDVVIVGGGPAGLSAALVLGRCRRRVLLCDAGTPRNAKSLALHGYLTRDGIPPLDLLRIGCDELSPYGIEYRQVIVTSITPRDAGFDVTIGDRDRLQARTVLIASGISDELPAIPGLDDCYGISAHHCPYCDGWEAREKAIAVIASGRGGTGLALSLKTWSDCISLLSNGAKMRREHQQQLADNDIAVHEQRIRSIQHRNGRVHGVVLSNNECLPCQAIFIGMPQRQQCNLARLLGCAVTRNGLVKTDHLGQTRVPGLYVAGDASRDVQFVVVAAAEGAKAAVAINKALQKSAGLAVAS